MYQALSRFSVLQATESWTGPGNSYCQAVFLINGRDTRLNTHKPIQDPKTALAMRSSALSCYVFCRVPGPCSVKSLPPEVCPSHPEKPDKAGSIDGMAASLHLCCVLGVICCLLSVVNTLWDRRGAVKVERRDSHRLYPPRNFSENLSYAFHFATDKFVSALDMAVQQLNTYHRPLLVHTRDMRDEVRRC